MNSLSAFLLLVLLIFLLLIFMIVGIVVNHSDAERQAFELRQLTRAMNRLSQQIEDLNI